MCNIVRLLKSSANQRNPDAFFNAERTYYIFAEYFVEAWTLKIASRQKNSNYEITIAVFVNFDMFKCLVTFLNSCKQVRILLRTFLNIENIASYDGDKQIF